jgi:tetratricopeptide (TPR) repeat protein
MLLTGCHPYYNTFYNAEEAYAAARRQHRKAERVFPDSITVAPSGEMTALYDRSIEKSLKVMDVYPQAQKYHPRAHFLMGRASFYKLDFSVCVSRMRDLQLEYPESQLIPPGMVYVAKSHIMMDNLTIAEEILMDLLREHPRLDKNHEITMLLIDIAMRRGGRSQALLLLEGIGRGALTVERRLDIILRMADLNYELRQFDKALALLRGAPRSRRHPALMYRIDRAIYFNLDALDRFDDALNHLSAMQRNRRYAEQKYEIIFYRAMVLRRMGRLDEAIALLEEIRAMCGKITGRAAAGDAMSLCGRTSYELALIYQELGLYDKAAAAFEEASKQAGVPKASLRLWALNRLKELRTPDAEGHISAEARFSIAELFRFELEAPDSAYYFYMELADDTAAAPIRPRSLLAAAFVARHQQDNVPRSDSLYNVVIAEYDGTDYARRAQIEMDVEVTVVTARELAEREFRDAESLLENDPVEAVKAFYNVYLDHPATDIAPRSLHAAAWYTDNLLQRNRAAMTLYEELCEKFPETEYCKSSAAQRLSVARDSIEVRRQRREAAREEAEGAGTEVPAAIDDIEPDPVPETGTIDSPGTDDTDTNGAGASDARTRATDGADEGDAGADDGGTGGAETGESGGAVKKL